MRLQHVSQQAHILTWSRYKHVGVSHVPPDAGVYFVPAFNGLLAPRWRPDARGSILGISGATTKAHIVRAMLEAICWQVRPCRPRGLNAWYAAAHHSLVRLGTCLRAGTAAFFLLAQSLRAHLQVPCL